MLTAKQQKEIAVQNLRALKIFEPYIKTFETSGKVVLFEGSLSNYINNIKLYEKIDELESKYGYCVYAVIYSDGMYSFLCVGQYPEDNYLVQPIGNNTFYALAYVQNIYDDFCSESGIIMVKSVNGVIRRLG